MFLTIHRQFWVWRSAWRWTDIIVLAKPVIVLTHYWVTYTNTPWPGQNGRHSRRRRLWHALFSQIFSAFIYINIYIYSTEARSSGRIDKWSQLAQVITCRGTSAESPLHNLNQWCRNSLLYTYIYIYIYIYTYIYIIYVAKFQCVDMHSVIGCWDHEFSVTREDVDFDKYVWLISLKISRDLY